jgi:hypothetical protein
MSYFTNKLEDFALPLPITQTARTQAQQFATEQPTPQKAEQVRLNTLAVCVVNDYLQMLGVPTNLEASDSWNCVLRLCADVADLEVTGIGRLECRPYRGSQSTCYVPPEVWSDRIGYVVVEIDESSYEATVVGFTPYVSQEELAIAQLQPIDDLIDCLHPSLAPALVSTPAPQRTKVSLGQWLANAFEAGWEAVETLLAPAEPDLAFSFRSAPDLAIAEPELFDRGIRRAKIIDLGMQLAGYPVALVVNLQPTTEGKVNILLQVYPTGGAFLPPLLQLTVLDESGSIFLEAQARSADNYIQLQFSGLPGEQFSVKVALGDASVVEDFVI